MLRGSSSNEITDNMAWRMLAFMLLKKFTYS